MALVGKPNSGKSSLLAALTNARPAISTFPYTTQQPELGTMDYEGVKAQIVDLPSLGNSYFDIGLVNTADCILEVIEKIEDLPEIEKVLTRSVGNRLVVLSKIDLLDSNGRRKLEERCKSKRLPYILTSAVTKDGLNVLKEHIFKGMKVIRVYTKEPGKKPSPFPVVLPIGSTVRDVAESILKGFSSRVRETKVTGPSAKFMNQKVGLGHSLKDRDVVEFQTS